MRLGINLMAWSGQLGPAEIALFPTLARLGYAGVELPVFAPDAVDVPAIRGALDEQGLACTLSSALPRGASLLDAGEQAAGIAFLRSCLAVASGLGADVLCGPLYALVGHLTGAPRTPQEWASCVRALREVARAAERAGVRLALEPLNRFETYFLNTAADARRLTNEVGSDFLGVHLDTFHMNIEERDPVAAIADAGDRLVHFHCSENDRGIVGSGHLPWRRLRRALDDAGYDGWLVCETFNGRIPELAAAAAVWRPLVPDPLTYARESLRYLASLE